MSLLYPPDVFRRAILSSIPVETSQYAAVAPQYLYLPRSHSRALDPDNMLVVGMRGSGKSFWWHALRTEPLRAAIRAGFGEKADRYLTSVSAGFGEELSEKYPSKDSIRQVLENHSARMLWRTVVLSQVAHLPTTLKTWSQKTDWVSTHPDEADALLRRANANFAARGEKHIVLFDALDRTADSWHELRLILKGLLQVLLELRATTSIRAKAFVRPDHLDDPEVTTFPDASKVVTTRVSLDWPRAELYGLLWQYLGNAPKDGAEFRAASERYAKTRWKAVNDVWQMPERLRVEEGVQQQVFELIAGPYMGSNPRRGITYRWLHNHLADAKGLVSPRSFLAAIRTAAADESNRQSSVALHWESIKVGVQSASEIRVSELSEEYPWTEVLMEALRGLQIPARSSEIVKRWRAIGAFAAIARQPQIRQPRAREPDYLELIGELAEIGIFHLMSDQRINIPDVFRVGFGVLRKGCVKAL